MQSGGHRGGGTMAPRRAEGSGGQGPGPAAPVDPGRLPIWGRLGTWGACAGKRLPERGGLGQGLARGGACAVGRGYVPGSGSRAELAEPGHRPGLGPPRTLGGLFGPSLCAPPVPAESGVPPLAQALSGRRLGRPPFGLR